MTNIARRKAMVASGLMVCGYAGAAIWRPTIKLAEQLPKIDLERTFPKEFADWRVDDLIPVQLVSPDTEAMLGKLYNATLSRTYVNRTGARIMLSVAYGGDQSDATRAHRPEVCYPAQGFAMRDTRNGALEVGRSRSLPVRQLVAQQGGRIEPITFWITVGETVTLTGTEQKLAQLSYSTRGKVPDGMLVRVSSIDPSPYGAYVLHQDFVKSLYQAMKHDKNLSRVFGAT